MVTVPLSQDGWLNGIDIMGLQKCKNLYLFITKSKIQRREVKLNLTHRLLVQYGRAFSLDRNLEKHNPVLHDR